MELRDELQLSQKSAVFNGKRFGCVYSVKADLSKIPDEFQYRLSTHIRREGSSGETATPYREVAREIKMPCERLKKALENGLAVTALDGLFWFGMQRIAADVAILRKKRDAYCDLRGSGMGQSHHYPPPRTSIPLRLIRSLPLLLSFPGVLFSAIQALIKTCLHLSPNKPSPTQYPLVAVRTM